MNCIDVIKAASDSNRLRILMALHNCNELCVCYIVELLEVTGATVSRHLSILSNAGLINSRKKGRWVYYRISDDMDPGKQGFNKWLVKTAGSETVVIADKDKLRRILTNNNDSSCCLTT